MDFQMFCKPSENALLFKLRCQSVLVEIPCCFFLDFWGKLVLIYFWCLRILLVLVDDLLGICICGFNFSFRNDDYFDL